MLPNWRIKLNSIREKINIRLYDSKARVLQGLRRAGTLISITTILSLVYFHGFHLDEAHTAIVHFIIKFSIGFYIIKYLVEFIYSFSPIQHLKETKWEGLLMLYLVLDIAVINLFKVELMSSLGEYIGIEQLGGFFMLFIQAYFLLIVFLELGKASTFLPFVSLSPPAMMALSFVVLIAVGTGLLMLPEMRTAGESMPFFDALFTSISASCVTGLIVVDTATYFTFKGQFILMLLIQLGGLNIISFATLLAMFTKKGIGIRHQSMLQHSYSSESLTSSAMLFRRIIRFTFQIELIGAFLLFFTWGPEMKFVSLGQRLFYSLFHSISAFNNAGFALFTNGLMENPIQHSYLFQLVIAGIIILGGLGFATINDVFTVKFVRERINKPWKPLSVGSRIALYSTVVLIIAGTLIFYILENNGVLRGASTGERLVASFFQSVTTRTAGFNTVDIGSLSLPILIFFMLLMFIGASPGSTGGGIKTTTFTLVFLSALATIRGKKKIELWRQTIPWDMLNRAFSVFLFSVSIIFLGAFALTITDPHLGFARLVFEEVSAFCTVGLSTGITADLSYAGKIVIMLSMFIGRIGTLTLAFALSSKKKESDDYKYPKASFMVG